MNLSLEQCYKCYAFINASERWHHDNWHAQQVGPNPACTICSAYVADWNLHMKQHEEVVALKALLNRLLGDVEAHLNFISVMGSGE